MNFSFLKAGLPCVVFIITGSAAAVCGYGRIHFAMQPESVQAVASETCGEEGWHRMMGKEMRALDRRRKKAQEGDDPAEFRRCSDEWLAFWDRYRVDGVVEEFDRKVALQAARDGQEGWEKDVYGAVQWKTGEMMRCWEVYRDAELELYRCYLGSDTQENQARMVARRGMLTMQFVKCWYQVARYSLWCVGDFPKLPDYW